MSESEDIEAYTKILKFQNKRYGVSIKDIIILIIGSILIFGSAVGFSLYATNTAATVIFIVQAVYAIFLVVGFFDYSTGVGIFNEIKVFSSSILFLGSVIVGTLSSIFSSWIFSTNSNILGTLLVIILLVQSGLISYFILVATPTRQGRDEMIEKLNEIKNEVEKIPISDLGSRKAMKRGIKWLEFQQKDDGIWGADNPLYESSEVLRTFSRVEKGLKHSWKRVVDGKEETRTAEQLYYLILEALETAHIEPTYEMLIPPLSVAEIEPDHINLNQEIFIEFEDELTELSEWEFVKSLQDYGESSTLITEIPTILPLSRIYYHKDEIETAQKCADIFSATFDILIRRTQTRFKNISDDQEISDLLLGKMYNALILMIRGTSGVDGSSLFDEFDIEDNQDETDLPEMDAETQTSSEDAEGMPVMPDIDDEVDTPDIEEQTQQSNDDMPEMPSASSDFDLPDIGTNEGEEFDIPSGMEIEDEEEAKIQIDVSMARIRNYLRSRQDIDGSWNNRIRDTAECLHAVLDQESAESEFIKLGVHYLLALQEKNGSWKDDVVLTSKVIRTLIKVNKSMGLGFY